ncbi:hypothetical protein D3C80_1805890 [compost metagenome]
MKTLKFKTNIKCSGCIATVTPKLNALAVENWEVDLNNPEKVLSVNGENISAEQVEEALAEVGYKAEEI